MTSTIYRTTVRNGVGESPPRPEGPDKATGNFAFASDLSADHMLWGALRRSPYAHARIVRIDTTPAVAMAGVHAVITQEDVAGRPVFGVLTPDQPVFAGEFVQFWGEPIAAVAADDLRTAERAAAAIIVELEELDPLVDPEEAERADSVFERRRIRRGDQTLRGEVVVEGFYEMGQQDQAPLGKEAGLAIPDGEGGVDLWATSQWIHSDHEQIVASLDMAPDQVRCHPPGMGGAFGAREDVSLHIHLCMLALRTGRPVKMDVDREQSFVTHVHRHPARMWYRHEADRDGKLVRVEARMILDGGAYGSTTPQVMTNAAVFGVGPYKVESVAIDAAGVKTNNPPAGAMRGFGNVQSGFAAEMQMTRLAEELGMDQLEFRRRNALEHGDHFSTTGQYLEGSFPTTAVIDALADIPLPDPVVADDPRSRPGGTGLTTDPRHVQRGVGYAVSVKNLAFSAGYDDYAEARVVLTGSGIEVETAAVEVGQGMVTVIQQLARTATGIEAVAVVWTDTSEIGSAGSTSASRQTQITGGAVFEAGQKVRAEVLDRFDGDDLNDAGVWRDGDLIASLDQICADGPIAHLVRFSHPETTPLDEDGQGNAHADYAIAAHRAVVDVDRELGLVRVLQVDTAQDVGKVLHPVALRGQIEGGILQGVGLAVMEELIVDDGRILNASFTDYLLPTFGDAPTVDYRFIEEPSHWGPLGAKGAGEPPTISSTPAVVAAISDAIGRPLSRAPVRPQDIVGL
ncbi:MAG: molybdopterin-dependent oxidoreductase [Acidimicrobiia bacterium]|nr:molybdopterin-dependent oxidoreductase [Acidimicrobiia bacterium]